MRAQLALRLAGGAFQRVGDLLQVLAVTHQLDAAQDDRARRRRAAAHDVRSRVLEVQRADGHDPALALIRLDELHQLAGEGLELRALRIGPSPLGDLARRARDRGCGRVEQFRSAGRGRAAPAFQLADGPLDALEQVGERRQVVQRREPAAAGRGRAGWRAAPARRGRARWR